MAWLMYLCNLSVFLNSRWPLPHTPKRLYAFVSSCQTEMNICLLNKHNWSNCFLRILALEKDSDVLINSADKEERQITTCMLLVHIVTLPDEYSVENLTHWRLFKNWQILSGIF